MRIYGRLWVARLSGGAAALAVLLLAGCGGAVNVVSEGADSNLMLGGNDAVAYFTAGKAVPGSSEIKTEHRGLTYRFSSVENRRQFITSPERYVPQFGGFSANGMVYAIPVVVDADSFKIIDGKLYLFEGERAKRYFEMDQETNLKRAWHYWDSEVKDSNWGLQTLKRTLIRVPHYRTDEELAKDYEKRFGRQPG